MGLNKTDSFNGFSEKSIIFLQKLKENNNKKWFEANKEIYIQHVLEPMQRLVSEMSDFILSIDPLIETAPVVSKTISRIYRDTRFSNDKSPYKTNLWLTFKRPIKEWQSFPCFFFELNPTSYRYGMGFYAANKETMDRFRTLIDRKPEEFRQAVSFYSDQNILKAEGDMYKRILDETKPPELLFWYQRKNLYFVCNKEIDNHIFNNTLVNDLKTGFTLVSDFYHYLYKSMSNFQIERS